MQFTIFKFDFDAKLCILRAAKWSYVDDEM